MPKKNCYNGKVRQHFGVYMKEGNGEKFNQVCQENGLAMTTVMAEFIQQIIDGDIEFCMGNRRLEFIYKDKMTGNEILWKDVMGE